MTEASTQLVVVDDDDALLSLLTRYLTENGYRVFPARDGNEMWSTLEQHEVNLVILDLMLPGESGLSLIAQLRQQRDIPIIMISARGEDVDRIVGLEVGADDYLAKPFNPRELLARIRAVLRRHQGGNDDNQGSLFQFGPYRIDYDQHQLYCGNEAITLTTGEFSLLRLFSQHPHKVMSRDRLLAELKGYERAPYDRSIDVCITRLRKKIEKDPGQPVYLRTIWGEGYMFCPTTTEQP